MGTSQRTEKSDKRNLQRHCGEVYTDQKETKEDSRKQNRILQKDDQQFTVEEMQIRAKMSDNKINAPGDATVSEMIKRMSLEKIYSIAECFRNVSWIR